MEAQLIDQVESAGEGGVVASLLNQWGWEVEGCPNDVRAMARQAVAWKEKRVGEILVELALATEEEIEHAVPAAKRADEPLLKFMARAKERVAQRADYILALKNQLPYYETLMRESEGLAVNREVLASGGEIARFCAQLKVVIGNVNGVFPLLWFGSFDEYRHFMSPSKAELQANRRLLELVKEHYKDTPPRFAIGPRTEIQVELAARGQGSASEAATETARTFVEADGNENLAIATLYAVLAYSIERNASDVWIKPKAEGGGGSIFHRIDGIQQKHPMSPELSPADYAAMHRFIAAHSGALPSGGGNTIRVSGDGSMRFIGKRRADLRVSLLATGEESEVSVVIRITASAQMSLKLEDRIQDPEGRDALDFAVQASNGLIVVSGPTGHGKSTTLASALYYHASLFGNTLKRIALEDPVERRHGDWISQINLQNLRSRFENMPERSRGNRTFTEMVHATVKRQDPDAIAIGEIRDRETVEMATSMAESGHLVFATTHANTAATTLDVIAGDLSPAMRFKLASFVTLLLAQRLVPRLCRCAEKRQINEDERALISRFAQEIGEPERIEEMPEIVKAPRGCKMCDGSGYRGRVQILEVLPVNAQLKAELGREEHKRAPGVLSQSRTLTLMQCFLRRLTAGEVSADQVRKAVALQ